MKEYRQTHYTIMDLAKVLNVDYKTICKRVEEGRIPFEEAKLTKRKLFRKEIIDTMFLTEADEHRAEA